MTVPPARRPLSRAAGSASVGLGIGVPPALEGSWDPFRAGPRPTVAGGGVVPPGPVPAVG